MRVVHDPDGDPRVLADDVDIAEGALETSRGLMFRSSIPENYALVFEFQGPDGPLATLFSRLSWYSPNAVARRFVHMGFVPFPIDVLWLRGETVTKATTLRPWIGLGMASADRIVELPAGTADGVEAGDRVVVT